MHPMLLPCLQNRAQCHATQTTTSRPSFQVVGTHHSLGDSPKCLTRKSTVLHIGPELPADTVCQRPKCHLLRQRLHQPPRLLATRGHLWSDLPRCLDVGRCALSQLVPVADASVSHADRTGGASCGTFAAAAAAVDVLQHRPLLPGLCFKGKQAQLAGRDAASASRTARRVNVSNFGCHGLK